MLILISFKGMLILIMRMQCMFWTRLKVNIHFSKKN